MSVLTLVDSTIEDREAPEKIITNRWTKLRYHAQQHALWESLKRFIIAPAGRRSGKTELAKRKLVKAAIRFHKFHNGRFVFFAPTRAQVKEIYWEDLKELVPKRFVSKVSETELTVWLISGTKIQCIGMDKPARAEGTPIDGCVVDEIADMKPDAWSKHIRPALDTVGREGWAILIGVPEGRNHFYELWERAQGDEDWDCFTWPTSDIAPKAAAKALEELDEDTYNQEYRASFLTFKSRAYYGFDRSKHALGTISYNPARPLYLCFDFNREPGVCMICQDGPAPGWMEDAPDGNILLVIDEVYIEKNSNTIRVCNKLTDKYDHDEHGHKGLVYLYGDATGRAKTSSSIAGGDWDLIRNCLSEVKNWDCKYRVGKANPSERDRINSVNSQLETASGVVRIAVDQRCKFTIRDFEGCTVNEDGELIKVQGGPLTHLTDGFGYMVHRRFPTRRKAVKQTSM